MIRPPKMAVLSLSVHSLLHQRPLHLHPTHMTDLPTYLCGHQLVIVLILDQNIYTLTAYQRGNERYVPLLVSPVTGKPTLSQFPV